MLKCLVCGGEIEGAVHVEPEGCYHPECFEKTDKGQKVKFMAELSNYAWQVYVENVVSQVLPQVKERFKDGVQKYGLSDDDLMAIIKSRFGL